MRIFFFLYAWLLCLSVTAQTAPAQTGAPVKQSHAPKLDELEVKDSSGTVYPTNIVASLMGTGKYGLKLAADHKSAILFELSAEQINKRMSNMPRPKESDFFTVGQKFPSFKERDMNGNKWNTKELIGKVVVMNFWFINCPPCRKEIPQLNEIVESYKDNKDVVFIAVALDEKYALVDFLKTTPFKYNIIDNGRYIASSYNIHLFPTHVVLDKEGKVIFHTSGLAGGTIPWIRKSIEAGLNGTDTK